MKHPALCNHQHGLCHLNNDVEMSSLEASALVYSATSKATGWKYRLRLIALQRSPKVESVSAEQNSSDRHSCARVHKSICIAYNDWSSLHTSTGISFGHIEHVKVVLQVLFQGIWAGPSNCQFMRKTISTWLALLMSDVSQELFKCARGPDSRARSRSYSRQFLGLACTFAPAKAAAQYYVDQPNYHLK